jgi:lipoate-protein ligase B
MDRPTETLAGDRLRLIDRGIADYGAALHQQLELHSGRLAGLIPDTVLICEHPPVITLGARKAANKLLVSPGHIAGQGIGLVEVTRGGGTTAHNPGQLVVYPILSLKERGISAGQYVRTLEAIGLGLLQDLGLQAQTRHGLPGLWVEDRKIASIGVRISKGITFHGMAVNIQNDLRIFDLFVPCGLDGVHMTSLLRETGKACPMACARDKAAQWLIRYLS